MSGPFTELGSIGHNRDWWANPETAMPEYGDLCGVGGCGSMAVGTLTPKVEIGEFKGEIIVALCERHAADWHVRP